MARQSDGETKTPVIVALVFFALATLTLGVLYYMAADQNSKLAEDAKKAAADKDAATKQLGAEKEKVLLYKVALGTGSQEELEALKNARNEADVRREYGALVEALRARAQQAATREQKNFIGTNVKFDVTPDAVLQWNWADGGKPEAGPARTVLDAVVGSLAAQQLSAVRAAAQMREADQAKQVAADALKRAGEAEGRFKEAAAKFPELAEAITRKATDQIEANRKDFTTATAAYNKTTKDKEEEFARKQIELAEQQDRAKRLERRVNQFEQVAADQADPFAYDKPHGRVVGKRGNVVDINLGSADNVRPGLTFSVQPGDAATQGLQSRMRPRRGPDGQPVMANGRPAMEVVPKGTVEVIEVLGPNLSQARITANPDPIRDSIIPGDVLYNSAWRKGGADHVALFGVFDTNGDGTDDIRQVVADLSRTGVVVDAYFDLDQKKWVGRVTEQTTFAVEGAYPVTGAGDALAGPKSALDALLRQARQQAKDKGVQVVRARDFFTRIGYRFRLDVSTDATNRAFGRYLQNAPTTTDRPEEGN